MATKVVHGANPNFGKLPVNLNAKFEVTVTGHYVDQPGIAAAGVTHYAFQSNRPEKQVAELLALRTAFRHFYERSMRNRGITPTGEYAL